MYLQFNIGLTMLMLVLVAGCGRKGDVLNLISENYKSLKTEGKVYFIEYKEKSFTEWNERTYHISGIVKWEEAWYKVSRTFQSSYGMPDIIVLEDCVPMNKGVKFSSTIYKGNTDSKDCIKLDLPQGEYMTVDICKKRFTEACIVMPNGIITGKSLDKKQFYKGQEKAIKDSADFVQETPKYMTDIKKEVEQLLEMNFGRLNDSALFSYKERCHGIASKVKLKQTMYSTIQSSLLYFIDFPVEQLKSKEADIALSSIKCLGNEIEQCQRMVANRITAVEDEQLMRKKEGIVFLKNRVRCWEC